MKDTFYHILKNGAAKEHGKLALLYSEFGACTERTAKDHIKKGLFAGIILKDDKDGLYRLNNDVFDADDSVLG
jgi:hypothetical protein